jgi:hypothetical protein
MHTNKQSCIKQGNHAFVFNVSDFFFCYVDHENIKALAGVFNMHGFIGPQEQIECFMFVSHDNMTSRWSISGDSAVIN